MKPKEKIIKKIFATGGVYDEVTLKFLIALTGKKKPKICYLPTAVGDDSNAIKDWYALTASLPVKPFVQKLFVSTEEQTISFEETLLNMDAIVVAGGNTLNTIAVWKAQGIDKILKMAWKNGIVLSGSSAGAICWFKQGLSDSRPVQLSVVNGLGFLKGSNCPHYDTEKNRRPLLLQMISERKLQPGYACDETAGLYFENNLLKQVTRQNANDKAYKITVKKGQVIETVLKAELIN